jgi:stage III sporulation protein SpoIIIAA
MQLPHLLVDINDIFFLLTFEKYGFDVAPLSYLFNKTYVRLTLLLGPPSSGKSTFMRALTGKPDKNLKVAFVVPGIL